MNSTILCNSGIYFNLLEPDSIDVKITDIALSLSRICRFGGHTDKFYSVAQHSLLVSRLVPKQYALEGLLHDAAEAYIGDIVAPLKQFLPDYKAIEARIEAAIAKRFLLNTSTDCKNAIKKADLQLLLTEKRDLFNKETTDWAATNPLLNGLFPMKEKINPVYPFVAQELFITKFAELIKVKHGSPIHS